MKNNNKIFSSAFEYYVLITEIVDVIGMLRIKTKYPFEGRNNAKTDSSFTIVVKLFFNYKNYDLTGKCPKFGQGFRT